MLLLRRGGTPSSAGTSNSAYPPHLSDPVKAGNGDHVPGRSIGRCDVSLVDQVPGRNLTLYRLGLEIRPRCCALSGHLRSPERHWLRELLSREVVESAKKPHRVLFYPACSQDPTSKRLHFLVICLIAHRVRLSRSTVLRRVFVLFLHDLKALDHLEGVAHYAALLAPVLEVDGLVVVVDEDLRHNPAVVVEPLRPLWDGPVAYLASLLAHVRGLLFPLTNIATQGERGP